MEINQHVNNTAFCSAKLNRKGVEKFCNTWGARMSEKLAKTAEKAQKSVDNHLIMDEEGIIKLKNSKYGEFVTENPAKASVKGNRFSCDIVREDGSVDRFKLDMPDEQSAQELADRFGGGAYVPETRLDLFNAMEVASNYKKAMIDKIMKFSD